MNEVDLTNLYVPELGRVDLTDFPSMGSYDLSHVRDYTPGDFILITVIRIGQAVPAGYLRPWPSYTIAVNLDEFQTFYLREPKDIARFLSGVSHGENVVLSSYVLVTRGWKGLWFRRFLRGIVFDVSREELGFVPLKDPVMYYRPVVYRRGTLFDYARPDQGYGCFPVNDELEVCFYEERLR